MPNFTYESQGVNTYLVYQIKTEDDLDSMGLGMLTNNKIPGLAQTLFMQMDTTKYIKYNVSSKVSAKQFFSGVVNKKRLIGVFKGIVEGLLSAEDYMIDASTIVMDMEYIFADVSSSEATLICLPINEPEKKPVDLRDFFKNIMFTTQFDQTENCEHVAKIINFLNSASVFSLVDFKKLLEESKVDSPKSSARIQPPAQPSNSFQTQPAVPVYRAESQVQTSVPVQSVQAPVQAAASQRAPAPAPSNEKKIGMMTLLMHYNKENAAIYKAQKEAGKAQAKGVTAPPKSTQQPAATVASAGFAIPGQASQDSRMTEGPGRAQNVMTGTASTVAASEKQVGMMTLLMHYNKENAAAYKSQKEARKGQKELAKGESSKSAAAVVYPAPGQPYVAQPVITSAPRNPQNSNPEYSVQSPVPQPRPANFGETTVLGGSAVGETTVLSAGMQTAQASCAYLIRSKNNEKILLNKPVFRIGKEKSYVDYFIGDNTAISRSHVNITARDKEYFIQDTNSTNHTFVNGAMIQSNVEVQISHGDKIRLANEEFEFKLY